MPMASALQRLTVVDLSSHLSGPYCAMLLADHGADVIKIERPDSGDDARAMPPFVGGESAPFMIWNRNKRSVVIDLKTEAGKAQLLRPHRCRRRADREFPARHARSGWVSAGRRFRPAIRA